MSAGSKKFEGWLKGPTMPWWKQPLVHFLALGAALWAGSALREAPAPPDDAVIVVPPGLDDPAAIDQYARDEALTREALAMGLHTSDPIVRRRLAQKMRFLLRDLAVVEEPDDAALSDWLAQHPERFSRATRYALVHVYFNPEAREDAEADAVTALETLRAHPPEKPWALGDAFLHPHQLKGVDAGALDRSFGPGFGAQVTALEVGAWAGPLRSRYGLHLVKVTEAEAGDDAPALDDVREAVRADWLKARRTEAAAAAEAELLARYTVVGP